MFNRKIRFEKGYVHYREIQYPEQWLNRFPDKCCPLCNTPFKAGEPVAMVITNNTFPNNTLHVSCMDHDLLLTTHALQKSYKSFETCIRAHKGWIHRLSNV